MISQKLIVTNTDKLLGLNYKAASIFFGMGIFFSVIYLLFGSRTITEIFIVAYLLIAGMHHLYQYKFGRKAYLQRVLSGHNSLKWYEYAVTCSMMTLLVAVIIGITEWYFLATIVISTAIMMSTGYIIEKNYSINKTPSFLYLAVGIFVGICGFGVLLFDLLKNSLVIRDLILVVMLLSLYISFPINLYEYISNKEEKFITYEAVSISLSVISKFILASVLTILLLY